MIYNLKKGWDNDISMSHTLHPGIKIGPEISWKEKLEATRSRYCEVWYRVDWESKYEEMFAYLLKNQIHTGLHYWAMIDGTYMPNLAYPDSSIWKPTLETMKQNIDVASKHAFAYVNIHIGNFALIAHDLDNHTISCVQDSEVDSALAAQTFEEHVQTLHAYAEKKHVKLIVENIPPYNATREGHHEEVIPAFALDSHVLEDIAKRVGLHTNLDLGHTMAESPVQTAEGLSDYLFERAKAFQPYTALIHANTNIKPFTGTDSHDGITDDDFAHNVVPTKNQLIALLKLFTAQNDVWVVNEPKNQHIENYHALVAILNQL